MHETFCFVLMPFRPELNYFYLFLKHYLEDKYAVRVERGDTNILTQELMKKVGDQISAATFLIADITGNNPNVFFELGIGYANNKKIIFLTQDEPKDAPVDIRQYEFIRYDLNRHNEFLSKLDNAIRNVLGARLEFEQLFQRAKDLLKQFNNDTNCGHVQTSRDEFQARLVRAVELQGLPSLKDDVLMTRFLLPKILQDATDLGIMQRVTEWLRDHLEQQT